MAAAAMGAPAPGAAGGRLLVLGPASSGRSALLFRAALAEASPAGRVLFLAPRPLQRLPGGGGPPMAGVPALALQRLQFLYPTSFRELLRLLASLHEAWPSSPSLMVLDSLEEYLASCPGPHTAAQLAALLLDTANHFSRKGGVEPAGCQLLVSMKFPGENGDGVEQLSVIQRYFSAQCWLHPETPTSGASNALEATRLVRARLSQPGADDQEWLLRFEPQAEMKISPLPCPRDGGASSGSKSPPASEDHRLLRTAGGPQPELLPTSSSKPLSTFPGLAVEDDVGR